jgi:hypothetical protein
MNLRKSLTSFLPVLLLLTVFSAARAQDKDTVPNAPSITTIKETYHLRVENALYGRVEISVDEGRRYTLIGRVLHPAAVIVPDKTATTPSTVLRGSGDGLALAATPGQALKLLPNAPHSPGKPGRPAPPPAPEAGAIVTNLEPGSAFFTDLLPPNGSEVRVQIGTHTAIPFPKDYGPSPQDVFHLSVQLPLPPPPAGTTLTEAERLSAFRIEMRKKIQQLGETYANGAIGRAEAEKRKVVSGTLNLRPKFPADEPEPIAAVSFILDDDSLSTTTVAPYTYEWDTRRATEGEHIIEIRALNPSGGIITRLRMLLVVHNPEASPDKKDKIRQDEQDYQDL